MRDVSHHAMNVREMLIIVVDVRMVFCMRGIVWWTVHQPHINGLRV